MSLARLAPLFAGLLLMLAGCGGSKFVEPQCRVRGKVLVAGKPAGDLCLRFQSADDPKRALVPDATWTEQDGSFALSVREPGEYLVTGFWPTVTTVEGERVEGPDRFNGKRNNASNPILKVSLVAGENVLPNIDIPR